MEGGQGGGEKVPPPFIKLKQGPYFLPFAPLFCLPTDKEQRARGATKKRYRTGWRRHKDTETETLRKKGQRHPEMQ